MAEPGVPYCRKSTWRKRPAWILGNERIQMTILTGGGHVAELRFHEATGNSSVNPMWEPPWETMDPARYRETRDAAEYGPAATGRFLAGMAGHTICLDYFGAPSEAEARQGLTIHGEASVRKWSVRGVQTGARQARLRLSVDLPYAGLELTRELRIRAGESVVYFRETVRNHNRTDHFFQWQQHVTLGASFLIPGRSRVTIPAKRAKTWLDGYGRKSLLEPDREFPWPCAPARDGSTADLSRPFVKRGTGFVAAARIDPDREHGFVAALDRKHHLLLGYSFSRHDFPWVAVWEENRARRDAPWNGHTLARGLEFGSSPFPGLRRESFSLGTMWDVPTLTMVPARGQKTVDYLAFLTPVPQGFTELQDLRIEDRQFCISGDAGEVRLAAFGLRPAARISPL